MTAADDLDLMHRLADAAGAAALPYFRTALEVGNKGERYDPVTVADRAAEQAMRRLLATERPDDGVLGEELDNREGRSGRTWILDPIDGTRAFVTGLPSWGTLIALAEGGVPVMGMMAQPFVGERFVADGKTASWLRGDKRRPLVTRPCPDLSRAIVLCTGPELFEGERRAAFERLAARVRHVRFGTDCYGYAMVAAGQADLVVEDQLKPYDIAPFVPMLAAAGGAVATWAGEPAMAGGAVVAAGDRALLPEVLEILAG